MTLSNFATTTSWIRGLTSTTTTTTTTTDRACFRVGKEPANAMTTATTTTTMTMTTTTITLKTTATTTAKAPELASSKGSTTVENFWCRQERIRNSDRCPALRLRPRPTRPSTASCRSTRKNEDHDDVTSPIQGLISNYTKEIKMTWYLLIVRGPNCFLSN